MTWFRDVVKVGMYHRFQQIDNRYVMQMDIEDDTITKELGEDYENAMSSFHYFNMMLCASYDTYGIEEYVDYIKKYIDASIIQHFSEDETKSFLKDAKR